MIELFTGNFTADCRACRFKAEPLCLRSGRVLARSRFYREKSGLGLWILLSGRRYAMDDRNADQTENADADPLCLDVEKIRSERQTDD
jgi:hypothetical protein